MWLLLLLGSQGYQQFKCTIISAVTHKLANIQAIEKKQPFVFLGLLLWASKLPTVIQKVIKLYLWVTHKIQTRPLFTLGFSSSGYCNIHNKISYYVFIRNQIEKLIYRINLSKLTKQKMHQLSFRVLCQFYTICYHAEYSRRHGYKNRVLMQVNLQWTLRENVTFLLVQKSRSMLSALSHKAIKDPNGEKTRSIRRYSTEMKRDLARQSQNLNSLITQL